MIIRVCSHVWDDCDRRFDNLSGSHLQRQVNCGTSVDGIMSIVIILIGQRSRDVIGRLSVCRDVIGCEGCKQ